MVFSKNFWAVGLLSFTPSLFLSFDSHATQFLLEEGLRRTTPKIVSKFRPQLHRFSSFKENHVYHKLKKQVNDHREKQVLFEEGTREHLPDSYTKHIPFFKGAVYQEGDRGYQEHREQYATSSYPKKEMSPFLIGYPKDKEDIASAINFAKIANKSIVARSGGHQYCGKSSGGKDTIVLSMDNFKTLQKKKNKEGLVEVGPAISLRKVNQQLTDWNLSIPHGECPYVSIGGHAQTGGYGHFLRSFGLNADYVEGFDIVLADGNSYSISRPKPNDNNTFNQEIFRSVLSGNAGSFGVVTGYTYNTIKDSDHPESYGFVQTRKYKGLVFKNLMQEVRKWTIQIANGIDDQSLRGLDFMMTLEGGPFSQYGFPLSLVPDLMGVELIYSDPDGNVPYKNQLQSIIDAAQQKMELEDLVISEFLDDFEEKKALSKLAHHFVRRFPLVTCEGREFNLPYKKRVNVTLDALTDGFLNAFTEQIDKTMKEEDIHLVFQMAFGGGAYRSKGHEVVDGLTVTSFPHRKAVWNFVYDLFYQPGKEQKAIDLQNEMQLIVDRHFNQDKQERRYFWGTFGNTNISEKKIQKIYYDNEKQYKDLQIVKQKYDPCNVFHTDLTVQLPKKKS